MSAFLITLTERAFGSVVAVANMVSPIMPLVEDSKIASLPITSVIDDDDFDTVSSPADSLFSSFSVASSDTSVASEDLWEEDVKIPPLTEAELQVVERTTNFGPSDPSHLISTPWSTTPDDSEPIAYTPLYKQVDVYDHAADLEAWDDGMYLEAEEQVEDWRAACVPLTTFKPVPAVAHFGPLDSGFAVAQPWAEEVSEVEETVEVPLYVHIADKHALGDSFADELFVESEVANLPDWRSNCGPFQFMAAPAPSSVAVVPAPAPLQVKPAALRVRFVDQLPVDRSYVPQPAVKREKSTSRLSKMWNRITKSTPLAGFIGDKSSAPGRTKRSLFEKMDFGRVEMLARPRFHL